MKRVNNETLLAWSDYEVIKARTVLHSAEAYNKLLEENVHAEREEEEQKECVKAFLKRNGYSEEELEP